MNSLGLAGDILSEVICSSEEGIKGKSDETDNIWKSAGADMEFFWEICNKRCIDVA